MDIEKKLEMDAAKNREKLNSIKAWPKRLEALKSRKENPMREAGFCREHKINKARFNRYKNLKERGLPSDSFLARIEAAFQSEGV